MEKLKNDEANCPSCGEVIKAAASNRQRPINCYALPIASPDEQFFSPNPPERVNDYETAGSIN